MTANVTVAYSIAEGSGGDPLAPSVTYGPPPADGLGYLDGSLIYPGASPNDVACVVAVEEGARLSGTVTIVANSTPVICSYGIPNGTPLRLLIDGVPQGGFVATPASWRVDTTQWPDGTHVLQLQLESKTTPVPPITGVHNGSRVVVFNNSGRPFTDLSGQAVVDFTMGEESETSLAYARVNVLPAQAYPMDDPFSVPTAAHAPTLATGKVWWLDGLTNPGTALYTGAPLLVKNRAGDYHATNWNPQESSGYSSAVAKPKTDAAPAFDGDRGVAVLSPYATLVPGAAVLASGNLGWAGVDISGRCVDVDTTGRVTTWFGPRSVAGQVQTNPNLRDVTLAQRIAAGEKEYAGAGPFPQMPQDIWLCTLIGDGDVWMLADTNANQVSMVSRTKQKIVKTVPLTAVTGVWGGFDLDWAVNATGLYKIDRTFTAALFAPIPNAFALRGDTHRNLIYVFDTQFGLYEVDPSTGAVTQRAARRTSAPFAFINMMIDDFDDGAGNQIGHVGPPGNIYYAAAQLGPYAFFQTPGQWVETRWLPKVLNIYNGYASEQVVDTFGHYTWGFAAHPTFASFVATGYANSSWHIVSAQLGALPPLDTAAVVSVYQRGRALMEGYRDTQIGLSAIFGFTGGAGYLGYTADQWRDATIADVQAAITPLLPASMPSSDVNALATYLWWQRTRPHFPS
jgi:hypothetical protein